MHEPEKPSGTHDKTKEGADSPSTKNKLQDLRNSLERAKKNKNELQEVKKRAEEIVSNPSPSGLEEQEEIQEAEKILVEIDALEHTDDEEQEGKASEDDAESNSETDTENSVEAPIQAAMSFMEKFSQAKGMEKLNVAMEKIGDIAEKIGDFLSQVGSSTLLNVATLLERFKVVNPAITEQLRIFAGSEKAVMQEQLKPLGMTLTKDPTGKDKESLVKLRQLFNAKKLVATAAPSTTYAFETYVKDVVMPVIGKKFGTNEKDENGRTKVTLREIVEKIKE